MVEWSCGEGCGCDEKLGRLGEVLSNEDVLKVGRELSWNVMTAEAQHRRSVTVQALNLRSARSGYEQTT
jgi:hypothetical protein